MARPEARCESAPILVIDDERIVRRSVRRTLLSRGFDNILTAGGGHEALEILRRQVVELVLLDLHMPGMNGMQVLREMLRLDRSLTVVLVTAEEDPAILARCLEIGAFDCLSKPTPANDLVDTVSRALRSNRRKTMPADEKP